MAQVFAMARELTGSFHPTDREAWLDWLGRVEHNRTRRVEMAAEAKAARLEDVGARGYARGELTAAREAVAAARRAEREGHRVTQLERELARDRQRREEAKFPGRRCRICRGLGRRGWQCKFHPDNGGQALHEAALPAPEPLWQRALRLRSEGAHDGPPSVGESSSEPASNSVEGQ